MSNFLILSTKGEFHNLKDTVLKYRMTFKTESQSKMLDHFKRRMRLGIGLLGVRY